MVVGSLLLETTGAAADAIKMSLGLYSIWMPLSSEYNVFLTLDLVLGVIGKFGNSTCLAFGILEFLDVRAKNFTSFKFFLLIRIYFLKFDDIIVKTDIQRTSTFLDFL